MEETSIPPGLRAGDGVFETVRTYSGRPAFLDQHLARLRSGARTIGLLAVPSAETLRRDCLEALRRAQATAGAREWVLRPMLYASSANARLAIPVEPLPVPTPEPRSKGVVAGISSYLHPGRYLTPPRATAPVKWLARGPLSHALREARARGWEEAVLEDEEGRLIEGTRSNLLVTVDGTLVSPGPESLALPGITRAVVLEEARRLGIPVEERAIARKEVRSATEVMLTSSLLGVASVTRLVGLWSGADARRLPLGSCLRRAYAARVRSQISP